MRFYLTADSDLKAIENYIKGYKRKNDGFYCDITAVKDKRSLAQNAIWWTLVSAVGRAMGEFKESAAVIVKKAYIKENNLDVWIDTHKLEVAKMSHLIDYAFWFLMNVAQGYLDESEGTQWLRYKEEL
jgi:hypothetical protein